MVWRAEDPQGYEAQKIAFEAVPFLRGRVLDLASGLRKVLPGRHIMAIDPRRDAPFAVPMECEKLDLFSDGGVDCVFSSHFLEHIEDYKAALAEWWRVLTPGGHLCLYLPHKDLYPNIGQPGANPDHKHDFLPEDITEAMKEVAWKSGKGWRQVRNEVRDKDREYSFWQVYEKRSTVECEEYVEKPRPERSLGLVRLGALGDAVWMTALSKMLKEDGWHITAYVQENGYKILHTDPHIDEFVVQAEGLFGADLEEFQLQMSYWQFCQLRHDKFVNICGSVERRQLYHLNDQNFFLPDEVRQRISKMNYFESMCEFADITYDPKRFRIKFTPKAAEVEWAKGEIGGRPFVLINPKGSGVAKYWPYTQETMEMLAAQGVSGAVAGELGEAKLTPPEGWKVYGKDQSIRRIFTLAQLSDAVVGPESAITNSVAHEPNLKVVFLGHSSVQNLTRDWENTISCTPEDLPCYPCHRVHVVADYCNFNKELKVAKCSFQYTPKTVVEVVLNWVNRRKAA